MTDIVENFLELDTRWIDEVDKYNDFYVDDIDSISIQYIFLNGDGEIQNIEEEITLLHTPNLLRKEEILFKIKNKLQDVKKYKLHSMIQFNVSLNEQETIALHNDDNIDFDNYIHELVTIEDINWKRTSNLFKDMNCLYFILMEKTVTTKKSRTKKIHVLERLQKNGKHIRNNKTRRR